MFFNALPFARQLGALPENTLALKFEHCVFEFQGERVKRQYSQPAAHFVQ